MQASEVNRLAEFEEWYWWHRARRTIVTRVLRRYVRSNSLSVLDVGCGAGGTSLALNEFGTVVGVDFGAEAAAVARSRGLDVARMDAIRLGLRSESFDLAVALDVLEHLGDDVAAARELGRVVRPAGLVVITVPAYQWLWSSHDVALGHQRRYRKGTIEGVLREGGLDVLMSSYIMSTALPAAAGARLAERLPRGRRRPASNVSGYVALPGFINEALSHLVGLDGFLAGRLSPPFGLSVLLVARRRAGE